MAATMRAGVRRARRATCSTHDPRVAIVLAEISTDVLRSAGDRADPARVVNVGIMEQTMVGVAAGFAMEGFHPIAHSLSPFMAERPYEQLKLDFGYQGLGGTFVGRRRVLRLRDVRAATHHSPADAGADARRSRGWRCWCPGHGDEVDRCSCARAYANGRPTYLRTSVDDERRGARGGARPASRSLRRGADATVARLRPDARPHARGLRRASTSRSPTRRASRPFDATALVALAGEAPDLVTVEPCYEGTAAPVVTAALVDRPMRYVSAGVPRAFIHAYGSPEDIDADVGVDEAGIRRSILRAMMR